MHDIFEHITCHSIAEAIEEVGTNTNECQENPWLVAEQVGKRFKRELLSTYRLQAFFGQQTTSQCTGGSKNTKEDTQHSADKGMQTK